MKEIKRILKPLGFRLHLEKWIRFFLLCETGALLIVLGLNIAGKFYYIRRLDWIMVGILAVGLILSIVLVILNRSGLQETALAYDRLGLDERLTTAIELIEENASDEVSQMVIQDAIEKGQEARLEKNYRLKLPKRTALAAAAVLAAIFATGFIQNPEMMDIKGHLAEQLKEIEQIKKDINKEELILGEELKDLNKEIGAITKEIKTAVNKKDGVKALDNAQEKLKKLEKSGSAKDLETLSQALGENNNTKGLSEAIQSGNLAAMEEELEKLNELLAGLSEEELEKLLAALEDKAKELGNEALKEALENYSENVSAGNFNPAVNGLESLKESMGSSMTSAESTKNAVSKLNQTLAEATAQLNQSENGTNSQDVDSAQPGEGGQNPAQGNGQEPGEGSGEGAGAGEGEGQGGNGNGPGGSQGTGQGAGQGQGWGSGHIESEMIYSREAAGKSDYETQIDGTENEGGQSVTEHQRTTGTEGESVPYDQVFGEYRREALKGLEESTIPYGMKDLVADYFSQLEK